MNAWNTFLEWLHPVTEFTSSAIRMTQVGTPFSYVMWVLLLLIAVALLFLVIITRLYMVPFLPFVLLGNFSEWMEGMRDDDGDGIRNKKDTDRNGDGILDRLQPANLFKRRKR